MIENNTLMDHTYACVLVCSALIMDLIISVISTYNLEHHIKHCSHCRWSNERRCITAKTMKIFGYGFFVTFTVFTWYSTVRILAS